MIYLGSHVSLKAPDYLLGSFQESVAYGANACMVYTGAPSNTRRVSLDKFKIPQAKAYGLAHGIEMDNVIVHAPYLINLANSIKPEVAEFGADFLKSELERTEAIGAKVLVLHPGCHLKAGESIGLEWIVRGLNTILDQDPSSVYIALETMAGKGTELGRSLEELALIRSRIHKPERIRYCLDTCHLNDAGYDIQDTDGLLAQVDAILGLDNVAVIHVNDSKNPRGAHKDRHANIGMGTIGFEALARIVHHPALEAIPKILETPYIDKKPPYKEEIERLRAYRSK